MDTIDTKDAREEGSRLSQPAPLDGDELSAAIEAVLFASGDPVPAKRIAQVLGVGEEEVLRSAKALGDAYSFHRRGSRALRLEDSLQLCSAPEFAQAITRTMEQRRPPRLSQAAMEVLAIVAYYQPVTRSYIEQVRGVDSSYTVGLLTERELIEPCGKLDVPSRPTLYRTGSLFLRTLGLQSLEELPPLPDLHTDEGVEQLQSAIQALKEAESGQMLMTPSGELLDTGVAGN